MLERVDRVQLAVRDRHAAAKAFAELLDARPARALPGSTSSAGARDS